MDIKCATWDDDIEYLSRLTTTLKTTMKVYTQALIHSNLFDAAQIKHGDFKDFTLAQMVLKQHKKPFVSAIIEGIFNVFVMYFRCIFNIFSMYSQCIFNVFSMYSRCIFNVFSMYFQYIVLLKKLNTFCFCYY